MTIVETVPNVTKVSPSLNSFSSLKPPGYYPITESIVTQLLSTEMSLVVARESKAIIINRVNSVDMAKYWLESRQCPNGGPIRTEYKPYRGIYPKHLNCDGLSFPVTDYHVDLICKK